MSGSSFFSRFRVDPFARKKQVRQKAHVGVEALEDRRLLSCTLIDGYVFRDHNANGLFDPGETVVAGSTVQLRNASNVVIATTTTDQNGYYFFDHDPTKSTAPTSQTQQISFADARTNLTQTQLLQQFDPALGTLTSVEISINGRITSQIKVENIDPVASSVVGTFSGSLRVTGPGFNASITTSTQSQTFNTGPFDGNMDFAGGSGMTFGPETVNGTQTLLISDAASLAQYIGTGQVTLSEVATTTSNASGGNLLALITGTGGADVTVKYNYIPDNCITPGNYKIVQPTQPAGLLDGQESTDGILVPNSVGTDTINLTVTSFDLLNNNFAELAPASISGVVFEDRNDSGFKDTGEPGIGGVGVRLVGTDDLGRSVSLPQTTLGDGSFRFANLRPGLYSLEETQPNGYLDGKDRYDPGLGQVSVNAGIGSNDRYDQIPLSEGQAAGSYNFGEVRGVGLQGSVYVDSNNNGIRDGGEFGIEDVTVALSGMTNGGIPVAQAALTDANGSYQFTNLLPGTYSLNESQPFLYLDGKDRLGTAGGTLGNDSASSIVLAGGTTGINYDFGELEPSSLSGVVYEDNDNDGVKDPLEQGIDGVTVTLTGNDDQGNPVSETTTTAGGGSYLFPDLRPGTYTVRETQPAGYTDGRDSVGSVGGTLSNDQVSSINLPAGVDGSNYNFGERPLSTIGGIVYEDTNNNGVPDSGEQGIGAVIMNLTGQDDQGNLVDLHTTTAADGTYRFTGLRPGVYTLRESQPASYLDGKDTVGAAGGILSNDRIDQINLPGGVTALGYHFGEVVPATISGFVFRDSNNDGLINNGERGIANVQVTLTGTNDLGQRVNLTMLTQGDGYYEFTGLRPGTYSLQESQPAQYLDGRDRMDPVGGFSASNFVIASNDNYAQIVMQQGGDGSYFNFAELDPASIAGFVYVDLNGNGAKNSGEAGIGGVVITLTGINDLGQSVNLTSTTASDGSYGFGGLRPGNYTLNEAQPAGYQDGLDSAGNYGGTAGNDVISGINLPMNGVGQNYNFGERPTIVSKFQFLASSRRRR
jgi:protocatechuate 3,4-dioxygenase beta subunit